MADWEVSHPNDLVNSYRPGTNLPQVRFRCMHGSVHFRGEHDLVVLLPAAQNAMWNTRIVGQELASRFRSDPPFDPRSIRNLVVAGFA